MRLAQIVFILAIMIGIARVLPGAKRDPAGDALNPATQGLSSEDPQLDTLKKVQKLESLANMIPSFAPVQWGELLDVARVAQEDPLAQVKAKNSNELEASWTNPVQTGLSKVGVGLSTD